jgi:hypothetical protein
MNDYDFKQLTQSARDSNLADYFLQSGYDIQRHGEEVYVKQFPGLCVNEKSNKWYSHYDGVGGSNSIDCLVKICGRDFRQAVRELTGHDVGVSEKPKRCKVFMERPWLDNQSTSEPIEKSEKQFQLPERGANMRRLFAYFCQSRKIPATVVEELVKANLLYQSAGQVATTIDGVPQIAKPPNAVFVHRDESGEAVGGEVQGINSYKRYKGVVAGTGDSVFAFSPTSSKINTAYLFESGIDLMSYYALTNKENLQGVSLISMAGLKPSVPKRLQADGVSVLSFVDNDDAGRKFESDNGFKRGSDVLEKADCKDWSDLCKMSADKSVKIEIIPPTIEPEQTTMKGIIRK